MKSLKIFQNSEFGEIRTMSINEEPYFMLTDVCRILDVNNSRQALTRLNEKGVITNDVLTNGGCQKATFINESNLYKLTFTSRKPEAERFTDWVTSEVLPAIRKHGAYMTGEKLEAMLQNPDTMIKLLQTLKAEKTAREAAEVNLVEANEQIEQQRPKVVFADAVSASSTSILIGDMAKLLKQNGHEIGQKRLFDWLRNNGFLIRRYGADYNSPTQRGMEMKLFEIKETAISHSDGHVTISKTTKVTGKGQCYFVNLFKDLASRKAD